MADTILYHLLTIIIGLISLVHTNAIEHDPIPPKNSYTNCNGLKDGIYFIKLLSDYPLIRVQCSNEYMIIDYSRDSAWSKYFSTWLKYHYAVAAPSRNDPSNWPHWFLPSKTNDDKWKFLLSPTCDVCNEGDTYHQKFGTQTSYYLSPLAFGCFAPVRGWPTCDMDFFSYECKLCSLDGSTLLSRNRGSLTQEELTRKDLAGICDFEIRPASQSLSILFSQCSDMSPNVYKPSIGIGGTHCICVKSDEKNAIKHMSEESDDTDKLETIEIPKTVENNKVTLHQKDFLKGTLRITESGSYVLKEDIILDFNAGHTHNPLRSGKAWWPESSQSNIYDGADSARGAYFLGFFAGITIECDNVVLDLNGYTIAMSPGFFYSQAFFSIIELSNQVFLPQQGPGFFGSDPVFANHILIKNGILGLSSHHGIHGNYNEFIEIRDLKIINFFTHGIQLNGYKHLWIENVNIGPTTTRAFLNGNYMQMRQILPILHQIAENTNNAKPIRFANREKSLSMMDIINDLEARMEKAFRYAVYGHDYTHDEEWPAISEVFVNPSGYPYGAVTYGLFLNYPSAGIFGWYVNDKISYNATVINVDIHGLRHRGEEVIGIAEGGRIICNAFNGPLSLKSLLGSEVKTAFAQALQMFSTANSWQYSGSEGEIDSHGIDDIPDNVRYPTYVGDIVTDVWLAMYYFGKNNFDYWPGIPYYGHDASLVDWAMRDKATNDVDVYFQASGTFATQCNVDAMFHPPKGLLGMKITGGKGITLNNIRIFDMLDISPLGTGSDECGYKDNYHFSQQAPYQRGYSMNQVHAITIDHSDVDMTSVSIAHIYSQTGLVFGLALWEGTTIMVRDNLIIHNLHAGYQIPSGHKLSAESRPNKAPEVCALRMSDSSLSVKFAEGTSIESLQQWCLSGYTGCVGYEKYSMVGSVLKEDSVSCETSPFMQHNVIHDNIRKKFINFVTIRDSRFLVFAMITTLVILGLVFVSWMCTNQYKEKNNNHLLHEYTNDAFVLIAEDDNNDDHYGTF